MVVPAPRDPDVTRDILTRWLGDPARLPGARITDLRTPVFTGFSGEILMLDVEHDGGTEALAVRVAPLHYQVFPEPSRIGYGLYEYWALGDHPSFR